MGGLFHKWRHPRRCFLVCATARTGSNLLTDGLHATRRAGRPKQFFLPKFEEEYGDSLGLNAGKDFAAYVRGVVEKTATSNEVFGFKLMGWYLEEFLQRLRGTSAFGKSSSSEGELLQNAFPGLRYVQVVRRNKVRQAISKARATQSGLWKIQSGNEAVAEPAFDPDLITRCLEESEQSENDWEQFFQRNALRPFRVEYEDLCRDFAGTILEVLHFLKISLPKNFVVAPPSTVRQTDSLSRQWEERYLANPGSLAPHI